VAKIAAKSRRNDGNEARSFAPEIYQKASIACFYIIRLYLAPLQYKKQ